MHGNVEKISVVSIGRMKEFIDRKKENAERAISLCFSLRLVGQVCRGSGGGFSLGV